MRVFLFFDHNFSRELYALLHFLAVLPRSEIFHMLHVHVKVDDNKFRARDWPLRMPERCAEPLASNTDDARVTCQQLSKTKTNKLRTTARYRQLI